MRCAIGLRLFRFGDSRARKNAVSLHWYTGKGQDRDMGKTLSVDKLLNAARKAAVAEDWMAAHRAYQQVLKRFPKNPRARDGLQKLAPKALPALLAQAQQLQNAAEWSDAARVLTAARDFAPDLAEVGLALAACLLEIGRAPAALDALSHVLARQPDNVTALNFQGRALREMGQSDAAQKSLEKAIKVGGPSAQTLNNLGILAQANGRADEAVDHFSRALALEPKNCELHFSLAQAKRHDPDDPAISDMQRLAGELSASAPGYARLQFALFKALDDVGAREAAFQHLILANDSEKKRKPYDFQKDAVPYALCRGLLGVAANHTAADAAPFTPIFVTGLPRSGTTLIERILSMADGAQACGELPVVQLAVSARLKAIMAREDKSFSADDAKDLRADILSGLSDYSDGRPVLIDKMPLNFRWIGFIAEALPEARIVHIARDPMAVAWSLFRLSFQSAGHGFVHSFEDIAKYMVLHQEWMSHWRGTYGERIVDLVYEDMIAHPQEQTQALAKAVGLAWSDAWLHPEKATSQVLTASAHQVRQPIYGDSNAQWKRYETQLEPLRIALSENGFAV